MTQEHKVSITLNGREYVISTSESIVYVEQAATLLDRTMQELSEAGIKREDQLALYSALKALVDAIKERDTYRTSIDEHTDRLTAAISDII